MTNATGLHGTSSTATALEGRGPRGEDVMTSSDGWINWTLDRAERVCGGYVVPIVCLFGIACNALNLAVLTRRQMSGSPYTYLLGLAVTDVSVLTLSVLESAICKPFGQGVYAWQIYDAFIYYPVSNVFSSSSVWITVLLTIERYISVRYPLKAKELCTRRLARRTIVIIVVWALAVNFPRFFCSTVVQSIPASTVTNDDLNGTAADGSLMRVEYKRVSTEFESSAFYGGWTWLMIVVVQMIPCVTLLFLNASLIAIVYRANRRRAELHAAGGTAGSTVTTLYNCGFVYSAEQIRMTVTCISIICLFLVCIVPSAFSNRPIAKALFGRGQTMDEFTRGPTFRLLRVVTNLLVYCNLSLNFLLYCVFNQKFLRVLRVIACRYLPTILHPEHAEQHHLGVGHQFTYNTARNCADFAGLRRASSAVSAGNTTSKAVGSLRSSVDASAGGLAARDHLVVGGSFDDSASSSTFVLPRNRRRGRYEAMVKANGQLSFQFALHEMPSRSSVARPMGASSDDHTSCRNRFD